jgi:hypothetical protein
LANITHAAWRGAIKRAAERISWPIREERSASRFKADTEVGPPKYDFSYLEGPAPSGPLDFTRALLQRLQCRLVLQQVGLPGEQDFAEILRGAGDLGELGAVRDQSGLDFELLGHAIAIGADFFLQVDFDLRE